MTPHIRTPRLIVALVAVLALVASAVAQAPPGTPALLQPHGNPTGPGYVTATPPWYYQVVPATTALPWPTNVSLLDVLATQGYNAAGGWTINRFDLPGNYRLDSYFAFADTVVEPPVYGFPGSSNNWTGSGGAFMALGLAPNAGATLPGDGRVHWLQVLHTNSPYNALNPIADGDWSWYIDNDANKKNSPFYDVAFGAANASGLVDDPSRPYGPKHWRAYTFVAAEDRRGGKKELYVANQGVYWGFDDPPASPNAVPAPGGIVLAGMSLCTLLAWRRAKGLLGKKEAATNPGLAA